MDAIERLKDERYNRAWIAGKLWPELSPKTATPKFMNKLHGKQGRKFNSDELKKIENILQNYLVY
jgi:hypothetical protein